MFSGEVQNSEFTTNITIEINQSLGYVVQLRANFNRLINPTVEKELVRFLRECSKKKNVALNGAT